MAKRNEMQPEVQDEADELKSRLAETEETLRAIQEYMVDAFVVNRENGIQVVTLNESEIPYRMMVESMNEGAVTLIPDGTIFYCNGRFGEMIQMDCEKLVGSSFHSLIVPEEQDAFQAILKNAVPHGVRAQFTLQTGAGNRLPTQLSLYLLGEDKLSGISVIATDLSERVQAEEALRKSETLFRLIANNSPDVIFSQDRDLRYTWIVNPANGLLPTDIIGKTDWDLLPPEEARRLTEIKEGVMKTGISHEEFITLSPNEMPRMYHAISQPIYDESHQVVGIASYARDITELAQAKEKIRSLAAELTRVEQEERQRISQVLHDDLQQRLFAIKAQLAFLKDVNLSADTYRELDQIQASLSESVAITRNLSIDLSPIVLRGEGLTEAMTWLAFRMKEQYGLQVDIEAKDSFNHLNNHLRMLLFHSVRELLFNVVKHAGILHANVTLEQLEGKSRITVGDDGKGFDTEAVLNNAQAAHGLLIIQDRLGLLGCRMKIKAKPGEGTQIMIDIPAETASA